MRIYLFIGFFTLSNTLFAQSLYNQGSLIAITANTTMTIPDSIINNGEITNNGNLIVHGTWINNSIYNPGTGSITLASSSSQLINHNDQSLIQLTISGGGDKIFQQDIIVEDQLILDDGLLVSSNGARIIVNDNAEIIGASESSYIVGEVVRRGTGLKYFPVGTMDAFLPLELTDVQGINPEIGVISDSDNINTDVVGTLDEVSARWFWYMELLSGEFDGSQIRLAINQENLAGTFEQYVVAESFDMENPFHSLGQDEIIGDNFDGSVFSSLKAVGGFYAVGLDLSITEPTPEINVFNAVTPNGDNLHEFLKIENIEFYPENEIVVYDKRGKKVYEATGYNNLDTVFTGLSNINNDEELPNGTYFYFIDKNDGSKAITGYFVLNK